jgi:hypothetical protein
VFTHRAPKSHGAVALSGSFLEAAMGVFSLRPVAGGGPIVVARFSSGEIQQLYEADDYPLRKPA